MITLKQRGRAGLQFLGSLQTFSSSTLRDIAEQDYAAQPEAPELAEEFKGDARPHVWQDRLRRARDVVERSKAYRLIGFTSAGSANRITSALSRLLRRAAPNGRPSPKPRSRKILRACS